MILYDIMTDWCILAIQWPLNDMWKRLWVIVHLSTTEPEIHLHRLSWSNVMEVNFGQGKITNKPQAIGDVNAGDILQVFGSL